MSFMWLQFSGPVGVPSAILVRRASPQLGRVMLQLVWPTTILLLLAWCIGAVAYVKPPPTCPALRGLTSEAFALQIITLLLLAIAGMYLLAAQPLITRLNSILGRGDILREALELIAEVPNGAEPASEDCVICLGCMEE